ncbi:MAG: hypothetical protein WDZ46_06780 [Solirubrobacterales bacterium]
MKSLKYARTGLLASLTAVAFLALSAGPAFAWNTTEDGVKMSGTITVKENGENAKTCTIPETLQNGTVEDNVTDWRFSITTALAGWQYAVLADCGEGNPNLRWRPEGNIWQEEGSSEFSVEFQETIYNWHESPFSSSWGPTDPIVVTWVNATEGTPSHITFDEDVIGVNYYLEPVTATGTVYFTTLSGGDLTVP